MRNTNASEIIDSFESSFADKKIIPYSLELVWLKKAIGKFSKELTPLNFDDEILEFDSKLDRYTIDTLGGFMMKYYQERQVSLVNKRVSIVGKDLSIDGSNGTKTAEKAYLDYINNETKEMINNQLPTAYI